MDKVTNTQIRELCRESKRLDEMIGEGVLWVERMEDDRIGKMMYIEECAGICSVGWLQRRWIDTVGDCLKKKKEAWISGKEGEWCKIGVNGEGL